MLASMAVASLPVIALWWTLYALDLIRGLWVLLFAVPAAIAFLLIESRVDEHLLRVTSRWANELPCETVQELARLNDPLPRGPLITLRQAPDDDVWARLAGAIRQSDDLRLTTIMPGTEIPELENAN